MIGFEPTFQLPDALPRIISGAKAGISYAAWLLANRYLVGDGLERNLGQAAHWFLIGARRGCHLAQRSCAWMIEECMVPGASALELLRWRRTAADNADRESQCLLGEMYLYGRLVPADLILGRKYLQLAADSLHNRAMRILAFLDAVGAPPPESPGAAFQILMQRVNRGDASAMYALSLCFATSWGTNEPAPEAARKYLDDAADCGHTQAMRDLARAMCKEVPNHSISHKAVNLLRRAARAGDGMSMALLGGYYCDPEVNDIELATTWFQRATNTSYCGAHAHWADGLVTLPTTTMNPQAAIRLTQMSLRQGFSDARNVLARIACMFSHALPCDSNLESMLTAGIYSNTLKPVVFMATQYLSQSIIKPEDSDQGRDLARKNHIKGLFWLQAAVEEMDTHAMFLLAHELFNPKGQAYDPASAVALLQSGAALEDQNCTALLAYQFNHHPGMIRNQYYGAKINFFAAKQGNYVAMQNLGTQLQNGEGVPIDHKAADFWLRRSFDKQMEDGGVDFLPSEVERHQVGRDEAKVFHLNFTLFKRGSRF